MILFKRRPGDKHSIKYFLPYGYMRRRLAHAYGLVVKDGEFVKSTISSANTSGFYWEDLLPLGVVMSRQARKLQEKTIAGTSDKRIVALDKRIVALQRSVAKLQADLNRQCTYLNAEIVRLSVENLRLRLQLRGR